MVARLAWFDDDIDDEFAVTLLGAIELDPSLEISVFDVNSIEGVHESVDSAVNGEFDVYIVDINLGLMHFTGVDLAQRLLQRRPLPVLALTRFPKLDELLNHLDPRVEPRELEKWDRHGSETFEHWFENSFKVVLDELCDRAPVQPLVDEESVGPAHDYFTADLADLQSKSFDDQLSMKSDAANSLAGVHAEVFANCHAAWVVVVGWPLAIVSVGNVDPPGADTLAALAREWKGPTMLWFRPAVVSALVSSEVSDERVCSPYNFGGARHVAGVDWFPSVELEWSGHAFEFHFDTGADRSFLSYTHMLAASAVKKFDDINEWGFISLRVGVDGERQIAVKLLKLKVRSPSLSGHLASDFRVYLVQDFKSSGLWLNCPSHCSWNPINCEAVGGLCRFRRGHLGRDLLLQTNWSAVIDTSKRRVVVIDKLEEVTRSDEPPRRGRLGSRRHR